MESQLWEALAHIKIEDLADFLDASDELLSPADKAEIEELYKAGEEFYAIAREHMTCLPNADADKIVERLLAKKSVVQRTLEWYKQGQRVLTASQFATITKGARTRGQLVLEKAADITDINTKPLCVRSMDIRPFDWGIRFEPVIKQFYQHVTHTLVGDLGRLMHDTRDNLAASPDGLVIEDLSGSIGCRKGRLVEFKAPITRVITEEVPKDYWVQMQIQMEVADVGLCDYFEVRIVSPASNKPYEKPESEKIIVEGRSFLIAKKETEELLRYEYSPWLDSAWEPPIEEDEMILETIPWFITGYNLKTVERSTEWFESMKPHIENFWLDVESAKKGEFVLPEVTRKRKAEECKIVDVE